jgi:hypothetical protein
MCRRKLVDLCEIAERCRPIAEVVEGDRTKLTLGQITANFERRAALREASQEADELTVGISHGARRDPPCFEGKPKEAGLWQIRQPRSLSPLRRDAGPAARAFSDVRGAGSAAGFWPSPAGLARREDPIVGDCRDGSPTWVTNSDR